jgi:large subunit ribosomal protein L24e
MDCTFCGREISRGTGKMYVKKDGTVYNFCSTKCEKNLLKNKRKTMKVRWTEGYQKNKKLTKK